MQLTLQPNLNDPALETMNFLNEVVMRFPKAISFAPGRPVERFFEVERRLEGVAHFVEHHGKKTGRDRDATYNFLGQYGRTNGIIADLVARHLAIDEQIEVEPAAIALTVGCQEGMAMVLMSLFDRDRDVLLVSDPSYVGITGTARILGIELHGVPMRDGELVAADVAAAMDAVRARGKNPRAFYHIPDFNNPLGSSMSHQARLDLLAMAEERDLLILEDNPYGMFVYDGEPLPTLKSMDSSKRVIYMGTFSKTLFPGLRLGYLVADQEVRHEDGRITLLADELSKVKSFISVNTSPILQAVAGGMLLEQDGSLRSLVAPKVAFYKANRDTMLAALETELSGTGVSWNRPAGGFFLTVDLPFSFDEASVATCAGEFGVIVCPMRIFTLGEGHDHQIRLSFSYVETHEIRRGIENLARYIRTRLT